MPAYATVQQLEDYLGVIFTAQQALQAEQLNLAVGSFIDRYTGSTWDPEDPAVTGEQHPLTTETAYLYLPPVSAVGAVAVRPSGSGGAWTMLPADRYELVDPERGELVIPGYAGSTARVDYTRELVPVPADIEYVAITLAVREAATMIAAQRTASLLAAQPGLAGIDSASVGQNAVTVKLSGSVTGSRPAGATVSWLGLDSTAQLILDRYRRPVIA